MLEGSSGKLPVQGRGWPSGMRGFYFYLQQTRSISPASCFLQRRRRGGGGGGGGGIVDMKGSGLSLG